jgi:hypothetical protein
LKKLVGLLLAGLAALLLFWVYQKLFPPEETVIRKRLAALAQAASLRADQSPLMRLAGADKLRGFFTTDVDISLAGTGAEWARIRGRDQLMELVKASRVNVKQLEIQFLDEQVSVAEDRLTANVHLTAIAHVNGERNAYVQELKFHLRKTGGEWAVSKIELVETLRR